jgi:thioredoxin reductase
LTESEKFGMLSLLILCINIEMVYTAIKLIRFASLKWRMKPMDYEVIIVGGGSAGLSAALVLGRSRRKVLVCDAGNPRNTPAAAAHNLLSRDGIAPLELLRLGREQLTPYTSVEYRQNMVQEITPLEQGFKVRLDDLSEITTKKVLLATGMVDELPDIPGVQQFWGKSVIHCPYCHGWEVQDLPLAVYAHGSVAVAASLMILQWTKDVVLCTGGPADLNDEEHQHLERAGIPLYEEPITALEGSDGRLERIVFKNGDVLTRKAMLLHAHMHQRSNLVEQLGCELTEHGSIKVDEIGQTSIPGIFAAGDAATHFTILAHAVSQGTLVGMFINTILQSEATGYRFM